MTRAHVTDTDHGYRALHARIARAAAGASVRVGLLGEKAAQVHEAEDGEPSSGITVGELGEIFEFGLGQPIRSWLRGYVDAEREQITERLRRVAKQVKAGAMTPEQGLDLVGLSIVGGIVQRIQAGIAPPVTAATQRRKGEDKTTALINSGQFVGSISHVVVPGAASGAA
jgi:hypothetical protein